MRFLDRIQIRRRRSTRCPAFRPGAEGLESRLVLSGSPIGVSLDFNGYGNGNPVWTDLHNQATSWQPVGDTSPVPLSADGYPLENAMTFIGVTNYPTGNYQFSYTGSGTVSFFNGASLVGTPTVSNGVTTGTVQIPDTSATGLLIKMYLTGVDPSNPMDNFHLMLPGYGNGTTPEPMFTPQFLQSLKPFSDIRFLNWEMVNDSTVSNWSQRVQPNAFLTDGPAGVPYEDMIELANEAHKDMWINIPALATPQFVQNLAQLVYSKLDPNLNVYFEYSNEDWNGAFSAYGQIAAAAANNTTLDQSLSQYQLVAQQSAYSLLADAKIFDQVFGSEAARVRPILGGQSSWTQFQQYELAYIQQTYGPPSQYIYATAVAPYFTYTGAQTTGLTVASILANFQAEIATTNLSWMQSDAAVAKQYDVPLIAYEGGPGVVPNSSDLAAMDQAENDPRMAAIYRQYLANWQSVGGGLFDAYQLTGGPSIYGIWGLLDNVTEAGSPKYDGVVSSFYQPGDANFDGTVDFGDFQVLASNYGAGNTYWSQGDFNGDGTVNWSDLNLLRQNLDPAGFTLAQFAQQAVFGQPATVDTPTALEYGGYGVTYAGSLPLGSTVGTVTAGVDSLGNPITLGGVPYGQGLGMTGGSSTVIALNGQYSQFDATIGVDGDGSSASSVIFQVYGDGSLLYQSPTESSGSSGVPIAVNVAGVQKLMLVVEAAPGSTAANDHGVWADARLVSTANFGATAPYSLTWQVSQNGQVISTQTGDSYVLPAVSGTYTVALTASDASGANATASTTVTVVNPVASATLLETDTTTQGAWIGKYGTQGYSLAGGETALPDYASVSVTGGALATWADNTTDPRGLSEPDAIGASAEAWSGSSLSIDVNLGDGKTHDVGIYAVDWDSQGRSEQVQVLNAQTGSVLDTETLSSFTGGVYLEWAVSGNVVIKVTDIAGPNAVVSGVFLDAGGSIPTATAATFLKNDTTTQGAWIGKYGTQGYSLAGMGSSLPSNVSVTPAAGTSVWAWASSTTDPRALSQPGGTGATAAAWYGSSVSIDVNLSDGKTHDVGIYAVDWDSQDRSEQVQVLNAQTGSVLDTETLSSFAGGVYLQWAVTGNVVIKVTDIAGPNAVISGVFLDASVSGPTATFVKSDTTTQGAWVGNYGTQGYSLAGMGSSLPSNDSVTPAAGTSVWTWASSTTDPRALRQPSGTGASAITWYGSSLSIDVNLGDGKTHNVGIYAVDWDNCDRSEQVQVLDAATGSVLDTQTISSFVGGVYLQWAVSGNVVIKVTDITGPNAVVSGVFLDAGGSAPPATAATFVKSDTTTQGAWVGNYGTQGYSLAGMGSSLPSNDSVTPAAGTSVWTWASSTTDPRALRQPSGTGASAITWYGSSLSIDVNLGDGKTHDVGIYAVDWDENDRSEQVQVLNAATGAVLDTQTISSFVGGEYLQWAVSGNVVIKVTDITGPNAVVSGVFID